MSSNTFAPSRKIKSPAKRDRETISQTFPVTGMSCASCAASVASILNDTEGVIDAKVNFADSSVQVAYRDDLSPIDLQQSVRAVGYDLIIDAEDPQEAQQAVQEKHYQDLKRSTIGSALLTIPVVILGMVWTDWEPGRWISLALTIPVLFWLGRRFFVNAARQARHGKATMDTLVALSTGIAFLFSLFNTLFPEFWLRQGLEPHVYYEAATVIITFISLGKLLEERAKSNTSSAIKKLMGLQPKTLLVVREGVESEISMASVRPGDVVVVRPGEKIPVDGQVLGRVDIQL